ncbi:unnamed protein product [Arabidopsis halleri]
MIIDKHMSELILVDKSNLLYEAFSLKSDLGYCFCDLFDVNRGN